jgi:hypothetical protein
MSNDFDLPTKSGAKAVNKPMSLKKPVAEPHVEETLKVEAAEGQSPGLPKYDSTELLRIFDEIIFAGEYVEEVLLRKRLPVKFSTRTAEQVGEIQDALDRANLSLISSVEQRRSIMSLEQSLVSFNGRDLSGESKAERSKFVASLAAPVIAILLTAMGDFDMKIAAACREEANF